jgi:Protein of unknown function (DUF2971)
VAELDLPILPEYLYRYRGLTGKDDEKHGRDTVFNRELAAILEPYIWCAEFNDLNDPMEGYFAPTRRLKKHSDLQNIIDDIVQRKSGVGLASFSDTNQSELMWTHYAGQSSGICIEYRPLALLKALPERATFARVSYSDKPMYVAVKDSTDPDAAVKKVLSQKKFNWAYEREWRLLSTLHTNHIRNKFTIRRIYLGSRISEPHKFKLRNALIGTRIRLYEMIVDGYSYTYQISKPSHRF